MRKRFAWQSMFLSDGARILLYYSAWRQNHTPVARWYLLMAAFGRIRRLTAMPRWSTPAWLRWDKARKWPVMAITEISGPTFLNIPGWTPILWPNDHPWFQDEGESEFRFAARPAGEDGLRFAPRPRLAQQADPRL
jgi:hypothetical protein